MMYYPMYFDPTYILVLIGVVICLIASAKMNSTFSRYSRVRNHSGMTGRDAAEQILHREGLYDVRIEHISGNLTDHYDPRTRTLRLSDATYNSTSVAALGVAAHECGHINFSNFEKRRIYASGIREGILYPELPEPKNEEEKQVLGELQVCLEQKKEKELRTKIELETAKAEVKKNEEIRKIVEEAYGQVDGADLEAFRQFMQEQAGKRKQQEEEFKGYDLGGI